MTDSLEKLFARLQAGGHGKPAHGTFSALSVPRYPQHYCAISDDGAPCLLLHAKPSVQQAIHPPLRLKGFSVQYNVPCRLVLPDGSSDERTLTTLICVNATPQEQSYFLHAAEIVLRIIGHEPDFPTVVSAIEHLASLFQRLSRPARQTVTGIIGELLLISLSASPHYAIQAWRGAMDDRYDFSADEVRLEVKSSRERERQHHLSYEQCHPPAGTIGILASIFVESAGGGMSLAELIESIEARLSGHNASILRLHEIVADTLGQTLIMALGERFDRRLAEESLQLYELGDIPAIRGPLPRWVSQVRFRVDLSASSNRSTEFFSSKSNTAHRLLPE